MKTKTKSKYTAKPTVNDNMVADTLNWIEQSLVEHIPEITGYPAFSVKLLEVALHGSSLVGMRVIKEENVSRAMEFLVASPVMNTPAIMFDPSFVSDLLAFAFNDKRATSAMPIGDGVRDDDAEEIVTE